MVAFLADLSLYVVLMSATVFGLNRLLNLQLRGLEFSSSAFALRQWDLRSSLILLSISLAQSWNIVAGYAGQVNLGHAAFFGLGALVARTLWIDGRPILLAMLAGAAIATLFALLIGVAAFRLRGAYFAIGTLALGEISRATVSNLLPEISEILGAGAPESLRARELLDSLDDRSA